MRKDIIIDQERAFLIHKMFELYATNQYSFEAIRIKITELGLRSLKGNKLSKSCVEKILRDSFYCGVAVSKKYGSYAHRYPRLISKELFDKCQEVRASRNYAPYKTKSKDFLFKGLIKCQNCGCAISFEHKKKPSGKEYNIGSCTNGRHICKRVYVNELDILKPIYEVLDQFESIDEQTQNDLVDELRKSTEDEVVYHKMQINRIRSENDNLLAKQNRLLEAFLDQSITKDIYDKKHQEYQDQIQVLEIELSEHQKADYDYQNTVAVVVSVARRARTIFENSSEVAEKRKFLSNILQNPILTGKILTFELKNPFDLVQKLALEQKKKVVISDNRLSWLRVVNNVITYFRDSTIYYHIPSVRDKGGEGKYD